MGLYNEIRPNKLNELLGNKSTIKSLKSILKSDNRPHTFLFCGERGTGKTTTARIMINELGCSNLDTLELNGSDNRGIDDAREVISIANTAPMGGKSRVIIYDEAHKLTNEAQNALLKILEDTPDTTYFILCSTDPDKLLKTVRSRCTMYKFELLNDNDMQELIERTLEKLNIELNDEIFLGIIDCANGSPRDALVLLEQIISVTDVKEQKSLLKKSLIEHDSIEICRLLMKGGSWKEISLVYKGIKDNDSENMRRLILGYMKTVLLSANNEKNMARASEVINLMKDDLFASGESELINNLYRLSVMF